MKDESTNTGEQIPCVLAKPIIKALVLLDSSAETTEYVDFLKQESLFTSGVSSSQELLDRSRDEEPHLVLVGENFNAIGQLNGREQYDLYPFVVRIQNPLPPPKTLFWPHNDWCLPDVCFNRPVDKAELVSFVITRIRALESSDHSSEGHFRL